MKTTVKKSTPENKETQKRTLKVHFGFIESIIFANTLEMNHILKENNYELRRFFTQKDTKSIWIEYNTLKN